MGWSTRAYAPSEPAPPAPRRRGRRAHRARPHRRGPPRPVARSVRSGDHAPRREPAAALVGASLRHGQSGPRRAVPGDVRRPHLPDHWRRVGGTGPPGGCAHRSCRGLRGRVAGPGDHAPRGHPRLLSHHPPRHHRDHHLRPRPSQRPDRHCHPPTARLARGGVTKVKALDYVLAARASGARESRVLWRHVVPNCLPPLLVQSTLFFATAILSAAYLGFLGLGAQPPTAEWGTMLSKARDFLRVAPHVSIFPGLTIMVTVIGLNLLGDGLRDVLDPRTRVA